MRLLPCCACIGCGPFIRCFVRCAGDEHKIRNVLLEILNRLPNNDVRVSLREKRVCFLSVAHVVADLLSACMAWPRSHTQTLKPYVLEMSKLVMGILDKDNEDNAIICLRIIFDLHKNFSGLLEGEVCGLRLGGLGTVADPAVFAAQSPCRSSSSCSSSSACTRICRARSRSRSRSG